MPDRATVSSNVRSWWEAVRPLSGHDPAEADVCSATRDGCDAPIPYVSVGSLECPELGESGTAAFEQPTAINAPSLSGGEGLDSLRPGEERSGSFGLRCGSRPHLERP